jgi:sec-independent protein translocase protein TatA
MAYCPPDRPPTEILDSYIRATGGRYASYGSSTANDQRGFAVPNIGPTELIIVLVIVLLIFGPKRLPGLGKQLGGGMREFKDSISGKSRDDDDDEDESDATDRRKTDAALGRPEGEKAPLEGEVVSERRP